MNAVYTDDPAQVHGCADCLELVAQDLADHNDYLVTACTAAGDHRPRRSGVAPAGPPGCPQCGQPGW